MYIPELDAIIFLATEFLEGSPDQPSLQTACDALYQAAGADTCSGYTVSNIFAATSSLYTNLLQELQPRPALLSAADLQTILVKGLALICYISCASQSKYALASSLLQVPAVPDCCGENQI